MDGSTFYFDMIFTRHGYPKTKKTNNATNLMSNEFEQYLKSKGTAHKKSIPYWSGSNREVERFSRTLSKQFRAAVTGNKN